MRGTTAGKESVIVDGAAEANPAVQPEFEVNSGGSHTLESRDFGDVRALRARLIEATVQAISAGSGPRLQRSRSWL